MKVASGYIKRLNKLLLVSPGAHSVNLGRLNNISASPCCIRLQKTPLGRGV